MKKKQKKQWLLGVFGVISLLCALWFYQGEQVQAAYAVSDCTHIPPGCKLLYWDNQTASARTIYGANACTLSCASTPVSSVKIYVEESSPPVNVEEAEKVKFAESAQTWFKSIDFDYKAWYSENKVLSWILGFVALMLFISQLITKDERG